MRIREQIIKDISECDYYKECGYDYWKHFLSDTNFTIDKEEYDEVLYDEFTEEEIEKIWESFNK